MSSASPSKTSEDASPWLDAWYDPVASIDAYSQCVRFADLDGTGDANMLVATLQKKLKVYRGTALLSEHALLDVPVALCAFYTDTNTPRTPAVAVASGPYVFIYRNLRPYFKFTLPNVEIHATEAEVWADLKGGRVDATQAYDALSTARDNGTPLSSRSKDLLSIEDPDAREEFVASTRQTALKQQTVITCMETLNKSMEGDTAVSSLVIGTENKEVLILNPAGSSIVVRSKLPAVPVFMAITGTFDVEYRITVACRDANVYTIKNGEVTGTVIELETQPCGIVRIGKQVLVGTMDKSIHAFHIKGKKAFSLYLPSLITCMSLLRLRRARVTSALIVGMANGEVRVYNDKALASTIDIGEPVQALAYGSYGREDNTLAIISKTGTLSFKMVRRSATLEGSSGPPGPPPEQDIPLNIPKKTRMYVEQTQREREQATEMHRLFQRDLCKLRLSTARSYVKMITDGQGPLSYGTAQSLRLNATVNGLGPKFKIVLTLQNTSPRVLTSLVLTFTYNHDVYVLAQPIHTVPLLLPHLQYKFETPVECIDPAGGADVIKAFVGSAESCLPVISAMVTMPMSEALEEGF